MRREFLLNVSFLVGVNLVIKPLYIFGIDLQVQNTVGSAAYGLFAALFSLTYILQIINDAGIQQYNSQSLSTDRSLLKERYPLLTSLKIWLGAAYLLTCLAASLLLGYHTTIWPLMLHVAANQMLLSWLLFLRSNVAGMGMYRRDSLLSVSDKIWMIALCGFLLYAPGWKDHFKLSYFIWAQTISLVLTILLARIFLQGRGLTWKGLSGWKRHWPLLRQSLPYALAVLLMAGYNRMDTLLLERLLPDGAAQAGVYYMAFRLLDALNNFAFLFGALLLPMFAYQLGQKQDTGPLVSLSMKLLFTGSMAVAAAVSRFSGQWIRLLYKEAPQEAGTALGILAWVFVPVCMMYVFGTLLAAGSRMRIMNAALVVTVVINAILLLVLIPSRGIAGAAWTALITQTGAALAMMFLAFRHMEVQREPRDWIRMGLFAVICLFILVVPIPEDTAWQFNFAAVFAGCLLVALLLGLLPLRPFFQMVRTRGKGFAGNLQDATPPDGPS